MTRETQAEADILFLMSRAEFRRWVLTTVRNAGIYASAYGSDGRNLPYGEGRRSLGLDILRDIARAAPVDDPEQQLSLTMIQLLREEAQPQEEPNGRRTRNRADPRTDTDAEPGAFDPGER